MSVDVENIVIGAGVIGLAIARALATAGREVLILERHRHFGEETSSRNSEVIHAGIYYPKDSLKARLCVAGKKLLYEYCQSRHIPRQRCGKLIVATEDAEVAPLVDISRRAAANGVVDLIPLSAAEAMRLEPALFCKAALLSPSTGIIDSHQLMLSYVGEIEDHGGQIAFATAFERAAPTRDGFEIRAGGETIRCRNLINSAGLHAQEVAANIHGLAPDLIPPRDIVKGSYFTMTKRSPFSRLIYPMPRTASLGIHVTIDLAGQIRFGPDQQWVDQLDYAVDGSRAESFYEAIRRYFPALPDGSLIPAYSGIRPKLKTQEGVSGDFCILDESAHRLPGLVNLFGMESPGLTSSLAIGAHVLDILRNKGRV
ncbi:NAD(P)/FAD-dependent oxidoreductase [Sneathiella sp.]|mgnify:CR=1 FL=1|uniref:NAD(P)/FAD-dependent oxidoreductase n=1 Tax=Sneathiella sp. TaxID=1964365 RepID=UPI002FE0AF87